MNETNVTMLGNAVEDPVLRFGKSGQPFITFRLASTVRRRDAATGKFADAGTNFVTVLAFRQLAKNVAESIHKGQPVVVTGRLRVNQWSSGDRTGTSVEIDATTVGHDLTRGVTGFTKVKTGAFGEGSFPADVPAALRIAGPTGADGHGAGAGGADATEAMPGEDADLDEAYAEETRYDDLDRPLPAYEPPYDEEAGEPTPYVERGARLGA